MKYYRRRESPTPSRFEKEYWGIAVDPDGVTRDRVEEREQHITDCAQELEFVRAKPPGTILDVGCGLGFFLSAVADSWEKQGVEISSYAAEIAKAHSDVHIGPLESAGYEDDYFDVVIMHHVIEHMTDPVANVSEVYRILKTGGSLIVGTPDFDSGCARRFGENFRLLHDPTHISLFTTESLRLMLTDLGFIIDRVEYPFFETRHFTKENLLRLFDTSQISPPFYGNVMTFYCHKP